jgi:hypothetical protein
MRKKTRTELDELMDAYDRKRGEAEKRAKKKRPEENEFLSDFSVCRDQAIRPSLQEIADHLRSHGHQCDILSSDERTEPDGTTLPAAITMEFYPAGIARRRFTETNTPHVSFIAHPDQGKVQIEENSTTPVAGGVGGWFGSKGEFSLEDIDNDFVQDHVLAMVRQVLSDLSR